MELKQLGNMDEMEQKQKLSMKYAVEGQSTFEVVNKIWWNSVCMMSRQDD